MAAIGLEKSILAMKKVEELFLEGRLTKGEYDDAVAIIDAKYIEEAKALREDILSIEGQVNRYTLSERLDRVNECIKKYPAQVAQILGYPHEKIRAVLNGTDTLKDFEQTLILNTFDSWIGR